MSEQMPEGKNVGLEPVVGRDRPAKDPGGCECMDCGCIFVGAEWHSVCGACNAEREKEMHTTYAEAERQEKLRRDVFGEPA